uniref:RGS domain-containing protein n=1 Tax=Parascaris univalens TaxID=6257 RepID=A0A915BX12_PARUN
MSTVKQRMPRSNSMPLRIAKTPQRIFNIVAFKCRAMRKVAVEAIMCRYGTRRRRSGEMQTQSCSSNRTPSPTSTQRLSPNEWTYAFDKVITDDEGRSQFTKFLQSEYSEE